MENAEVDRINKVLEARYGRTLRGDSNFRVVWSDDQYEYRFGRFNIFYGRIFVREEVGTRLVPKYSYIQQRWVLERFYDGSKLKTVDLPLSKDGGYEPVYVFESKSKEYLPPALVVCEVLIWFMMNDKATDAERRAFLERMMEKRDEDEDKYFDDVLREASPYTAGLIHSGEAILNPGFPRSEK